VIRLDAVDVVGTLTDADANAPVTSSTLDDTWKKTSVTCTLTAGDDLAGVKATYYRLNGGSTATYTAPFTISADGTTSVEYWSVDNRNNIETPNSARVRIDHDAPATSDDAPAGWVKGAATIRLSATDATSGVAETVYSLDGSQPTTPYTAPIVVSAEGTTTLKYCSTDIAGNTESVRSATVRVDGSAPDRS
jgi:hypothetical protein